MNDALRTADAIVIERVESENLAAQVEALANCGALPEARVLRVENAVAVVTDAKLGRKLNHVVGLGLGKPTNGDALKEIESLYESRGIPVEIDLCPFAEEATLELLKRREYAVNAFSSTFVHTSLHLCQGRDEESAIHIRDLSPDEEGRFIEWSQTGFAAHTVPRPADLLRLLAISALRRTDTQIKVAEIDGNVAGTAAVSIIGVEGTRAAHLFLASTLPEFRGRGVQGALLQARLDVARRAGAMLATVTARPTNSSARNTERAGFRLAFTKATFSRQPR